jgi:hypothetical protein
VSGCAKQALPFRFPSFYYPTDVSHGVQIMKLLVMHFSPASCHFVAVWPEHPPQHAIFEHAVCFSLNIREISHPYKRICKTAVMYIYFNIYVLDGKQKGGILK